MIIVFCLGKSKRCNSIILGYAMNTMDIYMQFGSLRTYGSMPEQFANLHTAFIRTRLSFFFLFLFNFLERSL